MALFGAVEFGFGWVAKIPVNFEAAKKAYSIVVVVYEDIEREKGATYQLCRYQLVVITNKYILFEPSVPVGLGCPLPCRI